MLQGANAQTSLLLVAYGLGSALSLGTLMVAGRSLVNRLKASIPVTGWLRRGAGVAVLAAAVVISTGADKTLLAGTSSEGLGSLEQGLLDSVPKVVDYVVSKVKADPARANAQGAMPALAGAVEWLNSPELTRESLKGKVVLVDFWTYDCINCQHTLPYVKRWAEKYAQDGLVVIGVHTPEYGYERIIGNVKDQVRKLGFHVGDVFVGPLGRGDIVFHRGVFGRHAEGVPTHRLQDVFTEHALVSGDHVTDGVVTHVPHV